MDSRERAAHRRIWSSACNPGHGDAGAGATGRHGDAGKGSADGRTTRRHGRALRQVDRTACRRIAALACARTRGRAGALGGASAPGRFCARGNGPKPGPAYRARTALRSEEHTSELQSLMRISYAVFCLKTKTQPAIINTQQNIDETTSRKRRK